MSQSSHYTQDDPRLRPLPLSTYTWTPIPNPANSDAIVKLSLIPTSTLEAPARMFTPAARDGEKITVPSWSFLLEKGEWAGMFDLGLRPDVENEPKPIREGPLKEFTVHPGQGPIECLEKGGFDISRIKLLVLSHQHFDRSIRIELTDRLKQPTGGLTTSGNLDTLPSPHPPIVLGPNTLESIGPGHPIDENSAWPSTWLQKYHFLELPDPKVEDDWTGEIASVGLPTTTDSGTHKEAGGGDTVTRKWERVGCFDKGVDWFGDGSVWLIDGPGHCPGHIMLLARVTADPPSWGDASHSQDLYLPVPSSSSSSSNQSEDDDARLPIPVIDGKPQLAIDSPLATYTIGQLTRMSAEENVMVLLAHEGIEGSGIVHWPGDFSRWKEGGWKEGKEREVGERAVKRSGKV